MVRSGIAVRCVELSSPPRRWSSTTTDALWLGGAVVLVLLVFRTITADTTRRLRHSRRSVGGRTIAARTAHAVSTAALPSTWSWIAVSAREAREWERVTGTAHLAAGAYATRVQNQHRAGWCGACYLVAVVQMIQDRWNLHIGQDAAVTHMQPYTEFDIQRIMDDYHDHRSALYPRWNACQGGDPRRVMACLENRVCRLYQAPLDGYQWFGHPSALNDDGTRRADTVGPPALDIHVTAFQTIPNERRLVMDVIYRRGTVVLGIDAECIIHADSEGVVDRASRHRRNHAVSVVGWVTHRNEEHWLVRNSWGTRDRPDNLPSNMHCVRRGVNECDEPTQPWTGSPQFPGYVLIPFEYIDTLAVEAQSESPWMECTLALRADDDAENYAPARRGRA